VAAAEWHGPVQDQQMMAKGVYSFSTPGHGGIVAIVGVAELTPESLAAARATGRIGLYVSIGGKSHSTSQGFTREGLADWIERNSRFEAVQIEYWAGEEDCEYATVMLGLSDKAFTKATTTDAKRMTIPAEEWLAQFGTRDYYRGVCARWSEDYLRALAYA